MTTSWIEASCFKYLICNYYDENDEKWDMIIPLKCGESCCKRVTHYIRISGNKWLKGPTVVTGDNICTNVPIVITDVEECSAQPGTILDICNVACARL